MCACCTSPAFRYAPAFPHSLKSIRQSPFAGNGRQWTRRRPWRASQNALGRAIQLGHVRDVGRVIRLGPDRCISSPDLGHWQPDDAHWKGPLDSAIALLHAHLHKALVAVYLRGSVAAGHAFSDGRSDMDLVALVQFSQEKSHASLSTKDDLVVMKRNISSSVRRDFPFVSNVDVSVWTLDAHGAAGLPECARFLLLGYCVPVFGVDVRASLGRPAPPLDALCDIRAREEQALRATAVDSTRREFVSWFLKFALRGLVGLVSPRTKLHARDIVPCARILAGAYPEHEALITKAAVLACGAGDKDWDRSAQSLVRDLADFAEREFLRTMFGAALYDPPRLANDLLAPPIDRPTALQNAREKAARAISVISRKVLGPRRPRNISFIRDELPRLALKVTKRARVISVSDRDRGTPLGNFYLREFRFPVVFRGVVGPETEYFRDSLTLVHKLVRSQALVSVRIASGNIFTFCRSTHPWISENRFTSPSVLLCMPANEFIARVNGASDVRPPPLRYANERAYLQSEVRPEESLFQVPNKCSVAQPERRWASTHGSVSATHYDCAHSALVQLSGEKRLIFFPPHILQQMGVYPQGHPMHRRVIASLGRPDALMFQDFWADGAGQAVEARLGPGDLVVFPPFWAHYTESIAAEGELSISHTIRFLIG